MSGVKTLLGLITYFGGLNMPTIDITDKYLLTEETQTKYKSEAELKRERKRLKNIENKKRGGFK